MCDICEGIGEVFIGFEVGFNPHNMELFDKEVWHPCECKEDEDL
jgi:hypothetical protein